MPPLPRETVKARAAALRAKGAARLAVHLDGWVGRSAVALVEEPGRARLADFTPIACADGAPGQRARFRFSGHDGSALRGEAD
jgi:threonylcarbamoyladenosine tRNA methylthiotransferase MtaB